MTFEPWLRRHPIGCYFALACGICWGGMLIVIGANGVELG